jgi:hypothetical protein
MIRELSENRERDVETGQCLKIIALLWIPFTLKANLANPHQLITAYGNGTLSSFDI